MFYYREIHLELQSTMSDWRCSISMWRWLHNNPSWLHLSMSWKSRLHQTMLKRLCILYWCMSMLSRIRDWRILQTSGESGVEWYVDLCLGCYNGCPCTYESQYCKTCEVRFEKEHDVCKGLNKKKLDSCLDKCSFDETCENECLVLYHYDAKVSYKHIHAKG